LSTIDCQGQISYSYPFKKNFPCIPEFYLQLMLIFIILLFGAPEQDDLVSNTVFFQDKSAEIMFGYNVSCDDIDYFGYMKKMLLTLHNVYMINDEVLPVHGAMVRIRLKSGKQANIIIVGDSGAGKSETLEAFRQLAKEHISEMTVIFDDMGSITIDSDSGRLLARGTEIGAFLRLDDLPGGYSDFYLKKRFP